ncbi:MAG: hypothetical protein R2710_05185 [Acidimicrobiales bacterium]
MTGATVSLTSVGTIGTVQSVPQLMPGQGRDHRRRPYRLPPAFEAADRRSSPNSACQGRRDDSTTDFHPHHPGRRVRVVPQPGSLTFLIRGDDFYDGLFADVGVPYMPGQLARRPRCHRGRRHQGLRQADGREHAGQPVPRPWSPDREHQSARRLGFGAPPQQAAPPSDSQSGTSTEFLTGIRDGVYASIGGQAKQMPLGDILGVLRDACCNIGVEYMHIADPAKRWIPGTGRGPPLHDGSPATACHVLERLTAAEALEKFLAARYVGQKRFGLEGLERHSGD